MNDKPPIFILVERDGCEDYLASTDVEEETVQKVVGRRYLRAQRSTQITSSPTTA